MAGGSAPRRRAHALLAVPLTVLVASCSTVPTPPPGRSALLWKAATECSAGISSLRIDRVDEDGSVHGVTLSRDQRQVALDSDRFNTCYRQRAGETLALAASPARITDVGLLPSRNPVTSVTVQVVDNAVLVPVVVNGSRPAWFIFDTGASITVLTPSLARQLGLDVPRDAQRTTAQVAGGQQVQVPLLRVASIAVGGARVDNHEVAIYDIRRSINTGATPTSADGLLGFDFLGRFTTTLNPRTRTLTLQLEELPAR